MHTLEKMLMKIEQKPWHCICRIMIGVCASEIFPLIFGVNGPTYAFFLLLIGMLGMLRLVPAILRRILPFSLETQAVWKKRRMLAKRYDSYQWQKLFWIGLGFAFDATLSGRYYNSSIILASVCIIPGVVGLVVWRNRCLTDKSIKALSQNIAAN